MTNFRQALPLLLLVLAAGCAQADDQETGSIARDDVLGAREELDPTVRASLDSGNAAYRTNDYEAARRHFRHAVDIDDDVAAGWFGVYMAELALGNADAAEEAMDRARSLAPGATLLHPEQPDTTR
jgi:tetratricopeptide (TPR) repeat protein